ncbi:MAG: chemotaxis protein CheW [Sphingomonadaceae bacterium]
MSMDAAGQLSDFALVQIGALQVGIEAACVAGAAVRPARLLPLPPLSPSLLGAFEHEGQALPLVDLRSWLGQAHAQPCAYVLILAQQGRRVGLAVDQIRGLRQIAAAAIEQLRHDDGDEAFFQRVARMPEQDGLLNLLEPVRLMERAQAWAGADAAQAQSAAALQASQRVTLALFQFGDLRLAVPAALVAEVISAPAVDRIFGGNGPLSGIARWRGQHVSVLERACISAAVAPQAPLLAVLRSGERCLGLPVEAALSVAEVETSALEYYSGAGEAAPLVVGEVPLVAGAPALLLDGVALMALCPALDAGVVVARAADAARNRDGYLICAAATTLAVPMAAVLAILPLPADLVRAGDERRVGHCHWQQQLVPVIELCPAEMAVSRVVVVQHQGRVAGLLVRDVLTIIRADMSVTRHMGVPGGATQALIMVEEGAGSATYRLLDVAAQFATLVAPA